MYFKDPYKSIFIGFKDFLLTNKSLSYLWDGIYWSCACFDPKWNKLQTNI